LRHLFFVALALTGCTPAAPSFCEVAPEGQISLPADESQHSEAVEWWYWTGHLQDDAGRWYGFEETFFLFQLGVFDGLVAHIGVVDVEAQRHEADFASTQGIPTPAAQGFDFTAGDNRAVGQGGDDHLVGHTDGFDFDVALTATKRPVFQHGDGYNDYDVGGYTWYYSRERMAISGTLTVDGEARVVVGEGWMDHQWGALVQASQAGWDWFALQLDDDREIMLFMMRGSDAVIGGSITGPDCGTRELRSSEINVTALGEWISPRTGCTYPLGWDLVVAGEAMHVDPVMDDQEMGSDQQTYWEGASVVTGDATGRAYVELAGYCQ